MPRDWSPAFADETPVLTVHRGHQEIRAFTLGDLEVFPQATITTGTPWHQRVETFSGVALDDFLASLGQPASRLRLLALNDYLVDADISDLAGTGAILAIRENGALMPVSDKGPVFLMFPFDSDVRLRHQSYYSRAVWQLCRIELS
ncbi:oxidoreductase [Aurantimonas sp. VKM B-3413]|uniref:oxidoreductase n=1 Tax=Aurantimonas sp. VKM B-3413 TaxID=2779401 RepID=UPI001E2F0CC9|nr:oxidoreductase [Aurantimonas sp. VKM B-3413]MCB8837579.1 oxidoreductase [Aurantimonas sp. VKM B-3413]